MKKQLLIALTTLALGFTAQAVPLTGHITFNGTVNLNTASAATATQVTGWHGIGGVGLPGVNDVDGDLDTFINPGDGVTFVAPWNFNSGPVLGFWTVGGYTFDLTSSAIFSQGAGTVTVNGTGIITGHGFTATKASWSFTTQDPSAGSPARFSISAASGSAPDGGSTLMLFGVALVGLSALRKAIKL